MLPCKVTVAVLLGLLYWQPSEAQVNVWAQCPSDLLGDADCPRGWVGFMTKCYEFVSFPRTTQSFAREACNKKGARLLRIDNEVQHNFISNWMDENSANQSMRWYTAGVMDAQRFGEFIWDGHPDNVKNFRTEVQKFWIEKPPKPEVAPIYNMDKKYVTYGTNGVLWGWFIDLGTVDRGYICEAEKAIIKELIPPIRSPEYGQYDLNNIQRGPCIQQRPISPWFVPEVMQSNPFVQFECIAYGNPRPTYQWFKVDSSNRRTLIEPRQDPTGRISQTNGKLVIHQPSQVRNSDRVQCSVANTLGAVLSRSVHIVFGTLDEFEKQPRTTKYVSAYTGLTLPCNAPKHSPQDSIIYSFYMIRGDQGQNQEPVLPELRRNIFVSQVKGYLGFSEVTTQDSGTYVCMISMKDSHGKVISDTRKSQDIPLQVNEAITSDIQPQIQDGFPAIGPSSPFRGQTVRIECFAYGMVRAVRLQYSWRKIGGTNEIPGRARIVEYGRVILINRVQFEDGGEYECSVKDHLGRQSTAKSVTLRVVSGPFFVTAPVDQVVDEGVEVIFICEAAGRPDIVHQWYRNTEPIRDVIARGDMDAARVEVMDGSAARAMLTIRGATKLDSGMYGCMAQNSYGTEFAYAQLRVLSFAPNFIKYPLLNIEGMQGQRVIVQCRPEAAPTPTISWYFQGSKLAPAQATRDINTGELQCAAKQCILSNNNLMVTGLVSSDTGNYTCEAQNALGKDQSSAYVEVVKAIDVTMSPISRIVQVNTTVDMPCRAVTAAHLDINYAWYFEGIELLFDRLDLDARRYDVAQYDRPYGRYFGTLRIQNVQFENEGNYSCIIQTPISQTAKWAVIRVAGPPGPCAGVVVPSNINTAYVPVEWTSGAQHQATITAFQVEVYSRLNKVWRVHVANLTDNDKIRIPDAGFVRYRRHYNLEGLASNMGYQVRIRAMNKFGVGEPSPPSDMFTTLPTKPVKVPKNITGGGGKMGTLVVRWDIIPKVDENAPGFYYQVQYQERTVPRQTDYTVKSSKSDAPKEVKMALKQLDFGRYLEATFMVGEKKSYLPYDIQVRGVNDIGPGTWSDQVTIMSAENMPSVAPSNQLAGALNSTALIVSWQRPILNKGEGKILGYRIVYWPRVNPCKSQQSNIDRFTMGQRKTLYQDVEEGVLVGLDWDTYYCIAVQVFNQAGDGPESGFTEQTTFKRAPQDFPTMVEVRATGVQSQIRVDWVGVQAKPQEESLDGYRIRYWIAGAPLKEAPKDVDCGLRTHGYVSGLSPDTRYNIRVFGYSRGGVGKMSSPMIQFMLIPGEKCIRGASWDGPDIRYVFMCSGCGLHYSIFLVLATWTFHWLVHRRL